jgi:hypothetical protein
MKMRTASEADLAKIQTAIETLRAVRDELKSAGCRQSARYVAKALKSVEGANRHAMRAAFAASEAEPRTGCWHYNYERFCTQCDPANYAGPL